MLMLLQSRRRPRFIDAPFCLAVGAPPGKRLTWASTAIQIGMLLRHVEAEAALAMITQKQPAAVVITPATYAQHGTLLVHRCAIAGARLVVVQADAAADELECSLRRSLPWVA